MNQGSTPELPGSAATPVAVRLDRLRSRLAAAAGRSGRPAAAVGLLAVAKQIDDATVGAAVAAGQTEFAESRVQALAARPEALRTGARWHLIGPLQSNKVARAVALAAEFHALDRAGLLAPLARAAAGRGRRLPVWLQVNIAAEPQKHGCRPDEAAALARAAARLPELELRGLMTIAPLAADPETVRPVFRDLRLLSERLRGEGALPPAAHGLSMGMSADFDVAIEEGATIVRLGSVLFRGDDPC